MATRSKKRTRKARASAHAREKHTRVIPTRVTKARAPSYSLARARWYLDTGKEQARERGLYARDADTSKRANYLASKRDTRVALLKANAKQLRAYFRGFESSDGYSLTKIEHWPAARVKRVEQYAEYLNHLLSQPHQRYVPRSLTQREVARAFTGQMLPDQKAFVMHVESDRDRVKITRYGDVVIERELRGRVAVVYDIYYLFAFYLGWRPSTWDQVVNATEDMLPYLPDDPDSRYFLHSELHGSIGAGQPKKSLLLMVKRFATDYALKNFADTIIGFRRAGSRAEADQIYARKVAHSQQRKELREKAWRALRARSVRRFKK